MSRVEPATRVESVRTASNPAHKQDGHLVADPVDRDAWRSGIPGRDRDGASARRRIAETGEGGAGLAIAGIVIGVIMLVLAIAYWAYIAMHTGGGSGGGGY